MNQQNETSIIIADDHQLLREGFQRMFANSCINIVAEAADGEELLLCGALTACFTSFVTNAREITNGIKEMNTDYRGNPNCRRRNEERLSWNAI